MSSWIFTLFSDPQKKLSECRQKVKKERTRLRTCQYEEQKKAHSAKNSMNSALSKKQLAQAHVYATQILAAEAAEIQVLQTIQKLEELERSLARSETVVQMEQVMTTMAEALAQLNAATPPQRMQYRMMHLERQHGQLEVKNEMMQDAAESMRETDLEGVDTTAADALSKMYESMQKGAGGGSSEYTLRATTTSSESTLDSAETELQRLDRLAEAEQNAAELDLSYKSLDPASKLVFEAARAIEARKAQASLPRIPRQSSPLSQAPMPKKAASSSGSSIPFTR
jgi:hypothetical protein